MARPAGLLAAGVPSTAVFAATDLNAVGTMNVLQGRGAATAPGPGHRRLRRRPRCRAGIAGLSTVTHDLARLGRLAAELLLRQVAGDRAARAPHRADDLPGP